jgi:tetratricopeptide (TPR) repeat protein
VLARYEDSSPIGRGARQGLLSVARTAGRYDEAFGHAWHAFREAGRDREKRIDALTQLGELCRRVGRYHAALRACEAALALQPPVRYIAPLHGTAMRAAESLHLFSRADEHAAVIAQVLPEKGYDTYGRADVWRDLAWWHAARDEAVGGKRDEARRCAREAQALALRYGYHEIAFEMDNLLAQLHGAARDVPALSRLGSIAERIVTDVAALPLTGELLLAIG